MLEETIHLSEVTKSARDVNAEWLLTLYPKIISWWIKGIHLDYKISQLLENTEYFTSSSVFPTNHKIKINKFTYIRPKIL